MGKISLIGLVLVYKSIKKVWLIRERLRAAHSRRKSYADMRRRNLEFEVNDWVYFKI